MHPETHRGEFVISTDPARLDVEVIHTFLRNSYWATGIPLTVLERSLSGSLCFGLYRGNEQIGFARVISDRATFAYLADVFILEKYRGQGLAKWLLQEIIQHPDLQGLRRFLLATRDAGDLYRQSGFQPLAQPERFLEIHHVGLYLK
jgi:GNAT superfamily N-acetyltransferase